MACKGIRDPGRISLGCFGACGDPGKLQIPWGFSKFKDGFKG